jgi:hypothetical protein
MTRKLPYLLSLLLLIFVSKTSAQNIAVTAPTAINTEAITTSSAVHPEIMNPAAKVKLQEELLKKQRQTTIANIKIDLKQQMKDAIQIKKTDLKEIIASREAEFRNKLQTIKDEKKKALTEKIDIKLKGINTRYTDRFTQVLGNLQTILDKMSGDLDKNASNMAINAARLMVENQATKIYTINITGDETLKGNVGTTTSQLRQDLVSTYKAVIDAKQTVQTLMKNVVNTKKEASVSANI